MKTIICIAAATAALVSIADMQAECQQLVDDAVARGEHCGVQFCAYRHGKKIVDVCAGRLSTRPDAPAVKGDSLFPIFSTEKPLLATAVHRVVEKGLMDYDKPLCTWWPELKGDGKEKLTLRETLGYRSGLPGGCPTRLSTHDLVDWDLVVREAAADKPEKTPGTVQRYMPYAYAWMLGHPLEVACGKPLKEVLDEEVLVPSGIEREFYFVVPRSEYPRVAKFYRSIFCEVMNEDWAREACLPSAWAVSSAQALCRFYNRLCGFDGKQPLIRRETLDAALKPCRHESDPLPSPQELKDDWHMIFGMGYGLWGEAERMDRVFGHGGAGGSEALVDRDNELVVAYTCNFSQNHDKLREALYEVVGMRWRYWKDKKSLQDLQMKSAAVSGGAMMQSGCATCPHPDSDGWEDVFNKDLSNAEMPVGSWKYDADGWLVSTTGDTILSKKDYGSVVVDLVYVMGNGANSGLFLYDTEHPKKKFEVQIMDDRSPVFADVHPYQRTGSVYGRCPAREVASRPAGEENRMTVWCEGDRIRVVVNGREVVDTDISKYVNAEVNPDGTPIPSYHAGFPALATIPRHGRIGLQGIHNTEATVRFKYLKVKEIK